MHPQGSYLELFNLPKREKGIRCKSGTVPAAVSPLFREMSLSHSLPLVTSLGRRDKRGRVRRPALPLQIYTRGFRVEINWYSSFLYSIDSSFNRSVQMLCLMFVANYNLLADV